MASPHNLLTVEVSGAPFDRGRSYGAAARDRIVASLNYYRVALPAQTGLEWKQVTGRAGRWVEPSRDFAPELITEIEGIAAGAGVDFLDVFTLNARGEIVYDANFRDLDASMAVDGCTSFALLPEATGDGHVYCGQNWDWRAGTRGTVVLLRVVQPDGPTIITQVEAGQIARQGANSAGIALNANGLGGRFDDRAGVPQTLIRRKVLDASTYGAALSVLVESQSQIASNALVTTRDGFAIDLETTPGSHDWLYPTDGVLVHGNHYQGRIPPQLAASYRPQSVSSLYRMPRVAAALRGCRHEQDSDAVRKLVHGAMSDHLGFPDAVCCHPNEGEPPWQQWSTVLSSCIDLTTGEYLIADGNPCENTYEAAPWNLYSEI